MYFETLCRFQNGFPITFQRESRCTMFFGVFQKQISVQTSNRAPGTGARTDDISHKKIAVNSNTHGPTVNNNRHAAAAAFGSVLSFSVWKPLRKIRVVRRPVGRSSVSSGVVAGPGVCLSPFLAARRCRRRRRRRRLVNDRTTAIGARTRRRGPQSICRGPGTAARRAYVPARNRNPVIYYTTEPRHFRGGSQKRFRSIPATTLYTCTHLRGRIRAIARRHVPYNIVRINRRARVTLSLGLSLSIRRLSVCLSLTPK